MDASKENKNKTLMGLIDALVEKGDKSELLVMMKTGKENMCTSIGSNVDMMGMLSGYLDNHEDLAKALALRTLVEMDKEEFDEFVNIMDTMSKLREGMGRSLGGAPKSKATGKPMTNEEMLADLKSMAQHGKAKLSGTIEELDEEQADAVKKMMGKWG